MSFAHRFQPPMQPPLNVAHTRANAVRAAFTAPDGADEQVLREEFNAMIAVS